MSDISFEEQIRLEEEERKRKIEEAETKKDADEFGRVFSADGLSYTDKDGCVFEWVADKNAWFPKIDEDFIARYQMNYGVEDAAEKQKEQQQSAEAAKQEEQKKEEKNAEAYRQWYSQYQQWYNSQIPKDSDASSLHSGGEASEGGAASTADATDALPPMPEDPNSEEYREWYAKWMEKNAQMSKAKKHKKKKDDKDEKEKVEGSAEEEEEEEDDDDEDDDEEDDDEEEYTYEDYMRYWNYYYAPLDKEEDKEGDAAKVEVGKKRKAPATKEPPAWFDVEDPTKNTNVYVSELPLDITMEEFKEFMSKVGIIMIDESTRQPKIKLYTDDEGQNKGDGRCCYLKYESVLLAEQILDGYELKGKKVKVEQAQFTLKGEFNPALRKKKKNNKKKKNAQEKMLEWQLEKGRGQRAKREKTTVLKNVFAADDFDADPTLINVLRDAVKTECAQFGEVKKVVVHDRNPEGVVCVIFAEAEHSDGCIAAMHDRLRAGRKISAECWDGKTKYDVKETDEERQKRIDKWQKYLAGEEEEDGGDAGEKEKIGDKEQKEEKSRANEKAVSKEGFDKSSNDEGEEKDDNDDDEDAREDERQNDFLENDDED